MPTVMRAGGGLADWDSGADARPTLASRAADAAAAPGRSLHQRAERCGVGAQDHAGSSARPSRPACRASAAGYRAAGRARRPRRGSAPAWSRPLALISAASCCACAPIMRASRAASERMAAAMRKPVGGALRGHCLAFRAHPRNRRRQGLRRQTESLHAGLHDADAVGIQHLAGQLGLQLLLEGREPRLAPDRC